MHVFDLSLYSQIEHYIIKTTYIDQDFKPCMAFRRNVRVRSQCYSCGVFLLFFFLKPQIIRVLRYCSLDLKTLNYFNCEYLHTIYYALHYLLKVFKFLLTVSNNVM